MTFDWLIRLGVSLFDFVVVAGFVIDYSRRPWRATPQGRALMYSKRAAAFVMGTAIFGAAWDFPGRVWALTAGLFVYGVVNLKLWRSMRAAGIEPEPRSPGVRWRGSQPPPVKDYDHDPQC